MIEKNQKLILFTNYYPYYKGEEYIENEILEASNQFSRILVIPTMVSLGMKKTRNVPKNVEVLDIKTDCSILGKIKMVFSKLPSVLKDPDIRLKELDFKKKLYSLYYFCRVEKVFESIIDKPEFKKYISSGGNFILYSYWMHVVASITARIHNRILPKNSVSITRGHRYDLYDYAAPCGYIPDRLYMLESMIGIYPCSEDGREYLAKKYPKYSNKIKVKRLGTLNHGRIECTRKQMFTIVSCSGVRNVKRLDKIIQVIKILRQDYNNVKWIHLGDGPEFVNIKNLANEKLPKGAFEFEGHLINEEVYDWYKTHSVSCFINLSDSEGVPVAIMEAMSFGIPIVATDVGGTREIVKNQENGYLISKNEKASRIASLITDIMQMSEEKYVELCKSSFRSWNDISNAEKLYKSFYEDIKHINNGVLL